MSATLPQHDARSCDVLNGVPQNSCAFRHHPAKSSLGYDTSREEHYNWTREPAANGIHRSRYHNTKRGLLDVPVSATPAIIEGIGVVVASDDGHVRFLNDRLTRHFWEKRLPSSVYAPLVVDPDQRSVIVCATDGTVCAFDLNGSTRWYKKLDHPVFAAPSVHRGSNLLILATFGDRALGLRLSDGESVFELPLPAPWYSEIDGLAASRNPYASPAVDVDGCILFASGSSVLKYKPAGNVIWCKDVGADIKSSPVLIDDCGLVAIFSVDGICHTLSLDSGAVLNRTKMGCKIVASGAVAKGIIAIGDSRGTLFGLNAASQTIEWVAQGAGPRDHTSVILTPDGNFVSLTERGNAVCIHACDGAFMWETSQVLGLPDQETRMDCTPVIGTSGRMYGTSYDGTVYQFQFPLR